MYSCNLVPSLHHYPIDRNFLTVRTMADHVPNDLLTEILVRLPVVSLLRFASVCKSWYCLITSPSFVTKHLNQSITNSKRNGDKLLVRLYDMSDKKERYLLLNDDEKFGDEYSELELPCKLPFGCSGVVGTCNGLLCLCDDCYSGQPQITIWNPSTRKSGTLPMAPKTQCPTIAAYGFGAHPTTQEYKVIRLEYKLEFLFEIPPKVEIYTQGTRSWRGISSAAPPHYIGAFMWSQAFLNGVVHWVACSSFDEGGFCCLIMLFDMASESFSEFVLPTTLVDEPLTSLLSIKLFGESLALICNRRRDGDACCIWVMKEYGVAESWTKLFSSNLLGMPNKALGFRKNGEVLLTSENSLTSYEHGTKTLRDTRILSNAGAFYVGIDSFTETLFLVEKETV